MKIFRQKEVLLTSLVLISIIVGVAILAYHSKNILDVFYCLFMLGGFIKYILIRLEIEDMGGIEIYTALEEEKRAKEKELEDSYQSLI